MHVKHNLFIIFFYKCWKWPGLDDIELIQNKIMNYCSRKRILLLFLFKSYSPVNIAHDTPLMTLVHCRDGHGGQGPPQYRGHGRWCGLGAPPTATPTSRLVVLGAALPGLAGGPVLPRPLPRHIRLLPHRE